MDIWIKRNLGILMVLLGTITLASFQQSIPCFKSSIDVCIEPLKKYSIDNSTMFPQLNRVQLTTLCSEYNTAEICLQPIKPACDLFQKRHYEGIELAFDYICGPGFEIYGKNYECFGLTQLRVRVDACNVSFQQQGTRIENEAQYLTSEEIQSELCSRMNDLLYCVTDEIASDCGKAAANWQLEVNKRSISPVLRELNCEIGRPSLSAGEIVGIVFGCIVFLTLLGVLIYYLTCNVRNYRKKKYVNQVTNNDNVNNGKSSTSVKSALKVPSHASQSTLASVPPDVQVQQASSPSHRPLPPISASSENLYHSASAPSDSLHPPASAPSDSLHPPASAPSDSLHPPPSAPSEASLRSNNNPSTRLNLSFTNDSNRTYETLPPSYTSAMAAQNINELHQSDQDTDLDQSHSHKKVDIF